jgi:hypothetical protein
VKVDVTARSLYAVEVSRGDMFMLCGIRRDAFEFLFIRVVFCILYSVCIYMYVH